MRIPGWATLLIACGSSAALHAQSSRITAPVDNARRVTLPGHVHPIATPANDRGRVDASLEIGNLMIQLKPSAAQQADLETLLARQQDPASPDFHHWLTPPQFGARFGVSQSDIGKITAWLTSQGLNVISVAQGQNAIEVTGSVRQVENAFGIEIHHYVVNGETHFANNTNPTVPAAFSGMVGSIQGLNDFRLKPAKLTY